MALVLWIKELAKCIPTSSYMRGPSWVALMGFTITDK